MWTWKTGFFFNSEQWFNGRWSALKVLECLGYLLMFTFLLRLSGQQQPSFVPSNSPFFAIQWNRLPIKFTDKTESAMDNLREEEIQPQILILMDTLSHHLLWLNPPCFNCFFRSLFNEGTRSLAAYTLNPVIFYYPHFGFVPLAVTPRFVWDTKHTTHNTRAIFLFHPSEKINQSV